MNIFFNCEQLFEIIFLTIKFFKLNKINRSQKLNKFFKKIYTHQEIKKKVIIYSLKNIIFAIYIITRYSCNKSLKKAITYLYLSTIRFNWALGLSWENYKNKVFKV